jgi:pimeloyl-ACP methyl ester carboxylesterase
MAAPPGAYVKVCRDNAGGLVAMASVEEYVRVGGAALWTARQGDGPALVDDLATVYRYDQRACGRSSGGPPYDVATADADLDALRAHWGLRDWVVAGHSWGATLALAYCLQHPTRARALIYISGTGTDPAWHAEYKANRAARLGPAGRRRLADLEARGKPIRAVCSGIGPVGAKHAPSEVVVLAHAVHGACFAPTAPDRPGQSFRKTL